MFEKIKFELIYSIELKALTNVLRYMNSITIYYVKRKELNDITINLNNRIAHYVKKELCIYYNIKPNEVQHFIDSHGNNYIGIRFYNNSIVQVVLWKAIFTGAYRSGKQPLSKTAVIISRTCQYRPDIEWLADVLR